MKFTEAELRAVETLKGNPDFGVFMRAIADDTATMNERLIKSPTGDEYLRGQVAHGSALLEEVNKAGMRLKKAAQPKT